MRVLKIYDVLYYVKIDDGDWQRVGEINCAMLDDTEVKERIVLNRVSFQHTFAYLQSNNLYGLYTDKTLLTRKPLICLYDDDSVWRYSNFDELTYKKCYVENTSMSLQKVFNIFPAERCVQYLQDRGINKENNTK